MATGRRNGSLKAAYLKAVVLLSSANVLPKRTPDAESDSNARAVMTAVLPSAPSQVLPAPSEPAGHRMFSTLLKPDSEVEGSP